jgi:hypothetical protein
MGMRGSVEPWNGVGCGERLPGGTEAPGRALSLRQCSARVLIVLETRREENTMNRRTALTLTAMALLCSGVSLSGVAVAQQFGTAAEAKAMLVKAVAAVKADKAKALAMFNKGEGGFKDRDLQPFCFNASDGKIVASTVPNLLGTDIRTLKDKNGKEFGQETYKAAIEGKITEISYMFPRPGTDPTLFQKVSFITGIGDIGCGVGYYK